MPAIERVLVRRPIRILKNMEPRLAADNIVWRVHRNGDISFPEFGEKGKRPKIPIETLAYLNPMFKIKGMDLPVTSEITFSTKPNLVPHIEADGKHIFFQLDARWYYITLGGFRELMRQLRALSPWAYRDLVRLRPVAGRTK
jgi:hypothetical protein